VRPTFQEMLAGIESVQSTVVMPRILATGEMDVLWEAGFAYRLLGFLREYGDRMLDGIFQENRDLRRLLKRIGPEVEAEIELIREPDRAEPWKRWASALTRFPDQDLDTGDPPLLESLYQENARLKTVLDQLIPLLEEPALRDPGVSGATGAPIWRKQVLQVIRDTVARQSALSEELLKLWRG
jgi:hypothetical protein